MRSRDNTYDVPVEIQLRILGLAPEQRTREAGDKLWIRIVTDPVVSERRSAVIDMRRALLGPLANNIFAPQFKSVPFRSENAHKDLSNVICDDDSCTFAIVGKMSHEERAALRQRVVDDKLQEGLYRASHVAPLDKHGISLYYRMSAEQKLAAAMELA
jgi:hypothetical protein